MHSLASTEEPPNGSAESSRSRALRQTWIVLAVACLLRLIVVCSVFARYPLSWFFSRGLEMGLLAKSILAGQGLASPFGTPTGPTAFIAPGYPLLVAAVFRLFGTASITSLILILSAHTALNLFTVWFILRVARELSGLRAAWIAGLFWACSPPLLWMPTIFWDTCISACVILGSIALALHWRNRFTARRAMLSGLGCALAGLINPAVLPALFAVVLWLSIQSSRSLRPILLRVSLAAVVFLAVFSPWPIRNARVFHAFIPLRTTVGFELWMGNRPGVTGYLDESIFPMYNPHELEEYKRLGEVAYTAAKSQLAKTYILAHPATFTALTARRFTRFWTGTGNQTGSPLFAIHACLSTLCGFAGLWTLLRRDHRKTVLLFALPLLLFPIPYYITHAEFRYRLVLDPLLTVLSGVWIAALTKPAPVALAPEHEVAVA